MAPQRGNASHLISVRRARGSKRCLAQGHLGLSMTLRVPVPTVYRYRSLLSYTLQCNVNIRSCFSEAQSQSNWQREEEITSLLNVCKYIFKDFQNKEWAETLQSYWSIELWSLPAPRGRLQTETFKIKASLTVGLQDSTHFLMKTLLFWRHPFLCSQCVTSGSLTRFDTRKQKPAAERECVLIY